MTHCLNTLTFPRLQRRAASSHVILLSQGTIIGASAAVGTQGIYHSPVCLLPPHFIFWISSDRNRVVFSRKTESHLSRKSHMTRRMETWLRTVTGARAEPVFVFPLRGWSEVSASSPCTVASLYLNTAEGPFPGFRELDEIVSDILWLVLT